MDAAHVDVESFVAFIQSQIRIRHWDLVDDSEHIRSFINDAAQRSRLMAPIATAAWLQLAPFGKLQRYIDDAAIDEIWVNAGDRVFVSRAGCAELTSDVIAEEELTAIIDRMLRRTHRRLDLQSPFVDVTLPDGSRLHAVIPAVTGKSVAVNIRKFPKRAFTLEDLHNRGCMTTTQMRYLREALADGKSVVVSGATNSGKTTMVRALLGALPVGTRIITCEEVFELAPTGIDVVCMQTRPPGIEGAGEISLRKLVVEALRMRPDVLAIGEVRQAEAFELLIALNSGVQGMCTVHANSADQALLKLTTLPLLAGGNVTPGFVVPAVAQSVNIVIHMVRDAIGQRRVAEIVKVTGSTGDSVASVPVAAEGHAA